MQKTYGLPWRHCDLKDLNIADTTGRLFYFIGNFIKPKSLKYKIEETLSDIKSQIRGSPSRKGDKSCIFLSVKIKETVAHFTYDKIIKFTSLRATTRYPPPLKPEYR